MTDRAIELVTQLGLRPHPEGGYYREVHRSDLLVQPPDGRGPRPALTTIYFLLPAGAVSRWHRVQSDEVWHFYEGAPLQLWITGPGGDSLTSNQLGPLDQGCSPVCAVPAGSWQAARSTGDYTLVSCTVGPGFDFADFTLAADNPAIAEMLGRHSTALGTLL